MRARERNFKFSLVSSGTTTNFSLLDQISLEKSNLYYSADTFIPDSHSQHRNDGF